MHHAQTGTNNYKTKNTPVTKKSAKNLKPVPKTASPPVVKKAPAVPPPVVKKVPELPPPVVKQPVVVTTKPVVPAIVEKSKPVAPPPAPGKKVVTSAPVVKTVKPVQPATAKQAPRQSTPVPKIATVQGPQATETIKPPVTDTVAVVKPRPVPIPPPPAIVAARANPLIKQIESEVGQIKVDLYDNGEIDGDTISVYHNNVLMISHARLTEKAITFNITLDLAHPHHELVMVAHNLGSIPPNTSLMVVTAGTKRYEVFISSNDQKNGKVVIDLKE